MTDELVHIQMVTYNHENYIAKAIESVLMQKTTFKYRLIIGEDCSIDNTASIVREFAEKYQQKITAFINEKNLGIFKNASQVKNATKAKYVAILEGDDYWTDPLKLQKQVDFLENNPDYTICFHPLEILNETTGEIEENTNQGLKDTFDINDLAKGNFIHTPSVVFRNGLFNMLDPIFNKVPAGDYLIHMLNARKGLIKKLDESMAVYRKHDNGIWSASDKVTMYKKWMKQMDIMIPLFKDYPEVCKNLLEQRNTCKKEIKRPNSFFLKFAIRIKDSFIYRLSLSKRK